MEAVYYLLPLSLILAVAALAGYLWALKRGQFEDLDTPPLRMLFDDEPVAPLNPDGSRGDSGRDRDAS